MITTTLDAMAAGGIHDHLGGGFARYSTDEAWLVPHFEKMLYDNALLTRAYLHGYLVTGEERYRDGRRGHRRLRAPRPHRSGRRLLRGRGRRLRGDRGQVLPLVARRDPRGVRRRRRRGRALLRRHRERELRRSPHRTTAATSCTRSTAPRPRPKPSSAAAPRCSRGESYASGPASTTRCCSAGTHCSSRRSPKPRPRSVATTG